MNKTVKVAAVGLGLVGIFVVGTLVGNAGTDLFTNAENQAYSNMLTVANDVNDDVAENADTDIEATITEGINETLEYNQEELRRLLEEYYALRLQGLTESERFKELEEKIRQTMLNVNSAFQEKIDQVFAEQGL